MSDEMQQVTQRSWVRRFIYKKATVKTTWKFLVTMLGCMVLLVSLTRGLWIPGIGRSLVCDAQTGSADAILIDNLDQNYLLFERAAALNKEGRGPRVIVPVSASADPEGPNGISKGIADLMARSARLQTWEVVPVQIVEPISLNVASQVRDFLEREHIRSVILVTPGFRSRRSWLAYRAVLSQIHIALLCDPVMGRTAETWTHTWHGIEDVTQQFLKLQYYRFWVLPTRR